MRVGAPPPICACAIPQPKAGIAATAARSSDNAVLRAQPGLRWAGIIRGRFTADTVAPSLNVVPAAEPNCLKLHYAKTSRFGDVMGLAPHPPTHGVQITQWMTEDHTKSGAAARVVAD